MLKGDVVRPPGQERRSNIRFPPDPDSQVLIDFARESSAFRPTLEGMVVDESYRGCSVVFPRSYEPQIGDRCLIAIGKLGTYLAEIKWREEVPQDLVKAGFELLSPHFE